MGPFDPSPLRHVGGAARQARRPTDVLPVLLGNSCSIMNSDIIPWVLVLHAFVTVFMTGLIWFVQIVHYPLFNCVGKADFAHYERQHTHRTGWLVGMPMVAELALAILLVWASDGLHAWCGLALLGAIWLCTALGQVPLHRRLARGFDLTAQRHLVHGNWIRTIAWTMRSVLALVMLTT